MTYLQYLKTRSKLSFVYRRFYLYPKLYKNLNAPLLDIGCGIGDFLNYRPDAIGVDIDPEIVSFCQQMGRKAYGFDGETLPAKNNSISSVILDNVLEHIEQPNDLLTDISRVIKIGGKFVVGVPGRRGYRADPDHKLYYDEKDVISLIERYKFRLDKCIHVPFKSNLLSDKIRQYCIYVYFTRVQV